MASGFGAFGGRGRCFPFFEDFEKCYQKAQTPYDCQLQREDYFECLHHKKEFTRLNEIQAARDEKAALEAAAERERAIATAKAAFAGAKPAAAH